MKKSNRISKVTGVSSRSKIKSLRDALLLQEDINFLITNRVPRLVLTRLMGRFSRIQNPAVGRFSIWAWKLFTDLDLSEAQEQRFRSLHACFTRQLRPGTRPIDPDSDVLVSPCDGIVGACGDVEGQTVFQAKGFPYALADLFGSEAAASQFQNGCYATLRLTSAMYHRFHAPADMTVENVTYISGDTWNVNPIALKRVERLFCKNERAAMLMRLDNAQPIAMVAIAAILVASIRLHFLNVLLHLRWKGPNNIPCNFRAARGEELGWFEHGSTIIVFGPKGFKLCDHIAPGVRVQMGQGLMRNTIE